MNASRRAPRYLPRIVPKLLVEAARQYGVSTGIAFQIKDDILDYSATDALGKPVGMDLREKKITLPLLGALQRVSDEEGREVRRMVCGIDAHPEYYEQIRAFVFREEGIAYAGSVLEEYVDRAKEALRAFPASVLASRASFGPAQYIR